MPALPPFFISMVAAGRSGGWRADTRLFAVTWAAGFVFFLILLA